MLKTDQPEVAHIQGLLATSTEHKLFLVRSQGCVPGAKSSQAKNHQTLKCKERNNWIDDSVTETQVCNNVRIEHRKTHFLFSNSDHALSHHTNSYFYCSDRLLWSGISQERTTCQAAKPTTGAFFSQANSQGFQFQKQQEQACTADFPWVCPGQPQLLHSGCSMLVLPSPVCLRYVVTLAPVVALCCRRVGYLAVHTQHTLKNSSNSGHKHLSDLIFHNYDH